MDRRRPTAARRSVAPKRARTRHPAACPVLRSHPKNAQLLLVVCAGHCGRCEARREQRADARHQRQAAMHSPQEEGRPNVRAPVRQEIRSQDGECARAHSFARVRDLQYTTKKEMKRCPSCAAYHGGGEGSAADGLLSAAPTQPHAFCDAAIRGVHARQQRKAKADGRTFCHLAPSSFGQPCLPCACPLALRRTGRSFA